MALKILDYDNMLIPFKNDLESRSDNYQKKINQADSKTITTMIFSIFILFFTIIALIYVLGKR